MSRRLIAEDLARSDPSLTMAEAQRRVDAVLDAVIRRVVGMEREPLKVHGLGLFRVSNTPAYAGRNPRTGETIQVEPGFRVSFTPSEGLRRAIGEARARRAATPKAA